MSHAANKVTVRTFQTLPFLRLLVSQIGCAERRRLLQLVSLRGFKYVEQLRRAERSAQHPKTNHVVAYCKAHSSVPRTSLTRRGLELSERSQGPSASRDPRFWMGLGLVRVVRAEGICSACRRPGTTPSSSARAVLDMGGDYPKGATPVQVDWQSDQYWKNRRLSPAQLQVHDIRLEDTGWKTDSHGMLEMHEVLSSTLLPALEERDRLAKSIDYENLTKNRSEQMNLRNLAHEYVWMNCLRSEDVQQSVADPANFRKCRWIHISSKFSDYLSGCLLALSDWNRKPSQVVRALQQLEHCVYQQERFSKHGRYFAPFFQYLLDDVDDEDDCTIDPLLLSVPFLDWSVEGETPPLRFQIDPREGYQSSRSSSHLLRSILQHFYRLEETADREPQQVFTKHKPWLTDRHLDLKVRRWSVQLTYPCFELTLTARLRTGMVIIQKLSMLMN